MVFEAWGSLMPSMKDGVAIAAMALEESTRRSPLSLRDGGGIRKRRDGKSFSHQSLMA
jgi:hypothetical protein